MARRPACPQLQFNPKVTLVAVFQDFSNYHIGLSQSLGTESVPIESNQTAMGTPEAVDITATLPLTGVVSELLRVWAILTSTSSAQAASSVVTLNMS